MPGTIIDAATTVKETAADRDERKLIAAGALDSVWARANTAVSGAITIDRRIPKVAKLDERISGLEEKLKQLKTRQARLDARKRALASRQERKNDTRRKILLGATVLARIDRKELDQAEVNRWLDQSLTRPDDRTLFGLPAGPSSP